MHATPTATTTTAARSRSIRSTRSRRRGLTALVALGVLLGAGACSSAAADGSASTPDTVVAGPVGTAGTEPGGSSGGTASSPDDAVTTASVNARIDRSLAAKAEPSVTASTVTTLAPTTELGSRTTLLVVGEQDDWVEVLLPIRPNGATGWLRKADVELRDNDMAITVDLAARQVTVTRAGATVLETEAAIGAGDTPTPTGTFSVTDLVETDGPNNAYGPYAIGLSGHSETLTEFGGGDGQVGLHGTNDPSSIGQAVSHGCVRVPNDVVTQLVQLVPLGTPVTIR